LGIRVEGTPRQKGKMKRRIKGGGNASWVNPRKVVRGVGQVAKTRSRRGVCVKKEGPKKEKGGSARTTWWEERGAGGGQPEFNGEEKEPTIWAEIY